MGQKRFEFPDDVVNRGPQAVEIYRACMERGESPRLAEMLAMQQAPFGMTDNVYFANNQRDMRSQWGDETDSIVEDAIRNYGYTPPQNMLYDPGMVPIGAQPGHPAAFYSLTDGRADKMRRKAASYQQAQVAMTAPSIPVAEDIVEERMQQVAVARGLTDHKPSSKELESLREEVRDAATPEWKK